MLSRRQQEAERLQVKLARASGEYLRAAKAAGYPSCFPTLYAEEDGEVVGVIGTSPDPLRTVIGPLWCPRRPKLLYNLLNTYEDLLAKAGVTTYWAHCPDPKWGRALVNHRQAKPVGNDWYRKDL